MNIAGITRSVLIRAGASLAIALGLAAPPAAEAWDVRCEVAPDEVCPDPFAAARTPWRSHPRAEHRRLLEVSMDVSGLPPELQQEFDLFVFVDDTRKVTTHDDVEYTSVLPVLRDATRKERRMASIPMFANLPDFAYTLWDWSSGNELCPPDPANDDPYDCHEYETHIGWLNSNHMLPQSRRWYEHMHALALERAAKCKVEFDRTPAEDRDRMRQYHEACEKLALVLEGVGHHYLQDSWAIGHMWERWGSTEPADFRGFLQLTPVQNRALGFWVGFFTGTIHGAKAVLDDHWLTLALAPWDDPLNAPHPNVSFRDAAGRYPGVGDMFISSMFGLGPSLPPLPQYEYSIQRKALLGCAVSGLREVYAATGQVHGPLLDALATEADLQRSVRDDSCWSQRVTNRALAEGFGLHGGTAPNQSSLAGASGPLIASMTLIALASQGPDFTLSLDLQQVFQRDAAYATTLALAKGLYPGTADDTDLASGGLPSLAGIKPNHHYARGNAALKQPPAFYADPFLPWPVLAADASTESGKHLNLTFSDANAGERCAELAAVDLETWRSIATAAYRSGTHAAARCDQCVTMVAPHLRRGRDGDHDRAREAYCALVWPADAQLVYSGEDPADFTGSEPKTFAALEDAARKWCGCTEEDNGGGGGSTTVLPPSGFKNIYAYDMNDSGHVVGDMWSDTVGVAFIWRGGAPTPLPRLNPDAAFSFAYGINARGDVVGVSDFRPVLWPGGGAPIELATRAAGSGWVLTDARLINDAGQIVGLGQFEGQQAYYFLDTDNSVTKIIDRVSNANVYGLSEDGDVAGVISVGTGATGFLWRRGRERIDIQGNVSSVNVDRVVAGNVRSSLSSTRGVIWRAPYTDQDITEIVPPDPAYMSWPQHVGDDGVVVGFFSGQDDNGNGFSKAFQWKSGRFTDLSALYGEGTNLQRAVRVGEGGQVLIYSMRPTDEGSQTYFMVVQAP
jgi:uncharacterized membrane protein